MNEEANAYQTITVDGPQLWAAVRQVRALGGVLLGYCATGDQYRLNFVLPQGDTIEALSREGSREGSDRKPLSGNHAGLTKKDRTNEDTESAETETHGR